MIKGHISVKVPETMEAKLKKIVELTSYISISEFVREAIREKINDLESRYGKDF